MDDDILVVGDIIVPKSSGRDRKTYLVLAPRGGQAGPGDFVEVWPRTYGEDVGIGFSRIPEWGDSWKRL